MTCRSVISSVTALGARSGPEVVEDAAAEEAGVADGGGDGVDEQPAGLAEHLPVDERLAPAGALELLGDAVARRPAEEDDRQLEVRAAGAAREALPAHRAPGPELDDRLERGPDLAVLDDLEEPLALLAVAHPRAHVRAGDGVVHEAQDLPLGALERAPQHEPVAGDEHRPLLEVRQGQAAHARVQELLDALDELAEVLGAEGRVAPAGPGEEEQEAVALALVARDEVVLAEALAHLLEERVHLGAQGAEGGAPEGALDVRERGSGRRGSRRGSPARAAGR